MSATIVRQRKLRTGALSFTATSANSTDLYLVVVSERCDKEKVSELFVAYTPAGGGPNPIPKGTLKQLGSNYLICDGVSAEVASEKSSLIFRVSVTWKEIESSEPEKQSAPFPNSGSTDPEDWTPTWSKRTQVVFEPALDGFYKGGFPDPSRGKSDMDSFTGRAPIRNSAGQPIDTGSVLQRRRRIFIWNFRWLRATLPANLMSAEGKANSVAFSFARNGRTFTFAPATAFIDTIDLSKYRWGNMNLVEISMEVVHDPNGIYWKLRDQGFDRRAEPGDKDNTGRTIGGVPGERVQIQQIVDQGGKPVIEQQDLDGDGQILAPGADIVYPEWSDFEEIDFDDVPLLKQI